MEEMAIILSSLSKEIDSNVKALSKIKDLDQKKTQAEIVKLLCESMGVFFDAMKTGDDMGDDDYDDDDMPF